MKYLLYISFIGAMASIFNVYFSSTLEEKINRIESKCISGEYYYK